MSPITCLDLEEGHKLQMCGASQNPTMIIGQKQSEPRSHDDHKGFQDIIRYFSLCTLCLSGLISVIMQLGGNVPHSVPHSTTEKRTARYAQDAKYAKKQPFIHSTKPQSVSFS